MSWITGAPTEIGLYWVETLKPRPEARFMMVGQSTMRRTGRTLDFWLHPRTNGFGNLVPAEDIVRHIKIEPPSTRWKPQPLMSAFGLEHGDRVVVTLKEASDDKEFRAVYLGTVNGATDRPGRRMFAVDNDDGDGWTMLMESQIKTAEAAMPDEIRRRFAQPREFIWRTKWGWARRMYPCTSISFHTIFDILVEECGAQEHSREEIISFLHSHDRSLGEHRFCGNLGTGGKLYIRNEFGDDDFRISVGYYAEHKTPEREASVHRANQRLTELVEGEATGANEAPIYWRAHVGSRDYSSTVVPSHVAGGEVRLGVSIGEEDGQWKFWAWGTDVRAERSPLGDADSEADATAKAERWIRNRRAESKAGVVFELVVGTEHAQSPERDRAENDVDEGQDAEERFLDQHWAAMESGDGYRFTPDDGWTPFVPKPGEDTLDATQGITLSWAAAWTMIAKPGAGWAILAPHGDIVGFLSMGQAGEPPFAWADSAVDLWRKRLAEEARRGRDEPSGGGGPEDFGGTDEGSHYMAQTSAADLLKELKGESDV